MDENIENRPETGTIEENAWWSDFFLGVILGQVVAGSYAIKSDEK